MMEINKHIEHTLLRQDAKREEIERLACEAKEYNFKGVCVNSCNVEIVREYLVGTDVQVVSVVGFPLGDCTTATKVFETTEAIKMGADEIDMVINTGRLKDGDFEYVINDIKSVKLACGERILKVIIETDLLTKSEIELACKLSVEGGADFVKTSTGFVKNGVGAKSEDVLLMYECVNSKGLQVKASGGIKDRVTALKMLEAGATRLGTSSGVEIMQGK